MSHAAMMHWPLAVAVQPKIPFAYAKQRALLALDGQRLTQDRQLAALKHCVQSSSRLDILLVNPPKAPTFLLAGLLLRLEHSGIDYRLTSAEGDFGDEIVRYLHRFQGIGLVIVDCLPPLERFLDLNQHGLCRKGRRFIGLSEPGSLTEQ